jgi:hypothetical protein
LSSVLLKPPFPLQAHEPQNKLLRTLPKNRVTIKIDQAFKIDTARTKKPVIRMASVEMAVRMD